VYGLFRPRPSAAVVPAAAAYATNVSSPGKSSSRSAKLPPLTVLVAAVRCIVRASATRQPGGFVERSLRSPIALIRRAAMPADRFHAIPDLEYEVGTASTEGPEAGRRSNR